MLWIFQIQPKKSTISESASFFHGKNMFQVNDVNGPIPCSNLSPSVGHMIFQLGTPAASAFCRCRSRWSPTCWNPKKLDFTKFNHWISPKDVVYITKNCWNKCENYMENPWKTTRIHGIWVWYSLEYWLIPSWLIPSSNETWRSGQSPE